MKKKIIGLLMLLLVISGVCFGAGGLKVMAAEGDVTTGNGFISVVYHDLSAYRKTDENVAPSAPAGYENYIFAGWYQDSACMTVDASVSRDTTLAYAKFVPAGVLSVKAQLKTDAAGSDKTNMRLVSSVDGLNYKNVGFHIYYNGSETPVPVQTSKVYKRIVASAESGVDYNYSSKVVDVESEYFVTATLLNIKKENYGNSFYIKPYWTTLDNTVVYGVGKYVTVNNGISSDNINLAIKADAEFSDALKVTVGENEYPTEVAYYDGAYNYINITVANRDTVLKSLNVVTATDGTTTGENTEYRNLHTKYVGTDASIDTSWFDVKGTNKKQYVIATSADIYGLAELVNDPTYYFGGQTIYMVADIEVNKGRATESGFVTTAEDGSVIDGATSYMWTPIGYEGKNFVGVFDGQGHTISGLNCISTSSATEAYLGLFGLVGTDGKINDFRLVNSYFEERKAASGQTNYTGSIAGRTNGNINSVYSDAYIKGYTAITGGIVGRTHSASAKTISNCWYAGTIIVESSSSNRNGGIIGQQWSGTVKLENCLFSGEIRISTGVTGNIKTGGFVGHSVTGLTIENCLNSGKIMNPVSASTTACGRVLGQNDAAVTLKNLYITNVGDITATWYNPGGLATGSEDVVKLDESIITGYNAYFNKILVTSDAWVVAEGTPELATFTTSTMGVPEVEGNIDWYTGYKDAEYTICDSEDNASNADDLYGFASMVNLGMDFSGKTVKMANGVTLNEGKVNADSDVKSLRPWTSIGTTENEFAGTFDGDMNSIKGIYINATKKGAGLFGLTAEGSNIQNIKLENGYLHTTAGYAGSIVGSASGNIENVYSNVEIKSTGSIAGGLVGEMHGSNEMNLSQCWYDGKVTNTKDTTGGIVALVSKGKVNMTNCLNTGELSGATNSIGGLCARTFRSTEKLAMNGTAVTTLEVHMTSCLNVGEVLSTSVAWSGSIIGRIQHVTKAMTCTNVYATNESCVVSDVVKPIGNGSLAGTSEPIHTLSERNLIGLLPHYNNILVDTDAWVPTETTPALKVFTDGIATESTAGVKFDWFTGLDETEYVICDEDTNEANIAELKGFAYLANNGINFEGMTVTLANDVTLNEETISELTEEQHADLDAWIPIGSEANKFAGTFDGSMHTINGLYIDSNAKGAAMFRGTTATSTIKNLKLKNAYITTSANFAGSFVGSASGNLENLYSDADIVTSSAYVGGIVGQTWTNAGNDIAISKCWFAGQINGASNIGGILAIGSKGNVELKDCLNTGNITYTTNASKPTLKWVGGLVGRTLRSSKEWSVTEDTTATMSFKMTNCLNAGTLTDSNDKRVGSALGQNNGPSVKFTNVYTTKESYKYDGDPTSVGRNNSGAEVEYGGIILADKSDMTAEFAYYNKVLVDVADTAWSLTTEIPILTIFIDEATPIATPVLEDTVNISWYNGIKAATHNVCTSEENTENVKQFYGFAYLVNHGVDFDDMTVEMANSVTVNESAVSTWNMSTKEGLTLWTPIGTDTLEFAGTFDGQMNTISGICVQVGVQGAGLFRNTSHGSTLKNFKLMNSYIDSTKSSSSIVGSVVGSCGGNLINVYSNSFVRAAGAYIGGIAGQIFGSGDVSIDGCWYAGTILNKTGSSNAGGIAGVITSGNITMKNCLNSGNITVAGDSVGGFFGRSFTAADRWALSGTGTATLTIENCLNTGTIKGNGSVGSIIGWKQRGTVNIGDAVYGTKTSTETKASGAVNNKWIGNGTVNSGVATLVDIADIKGYVAQNVLTGLNFSEDGKWALIDGATPQLRAFADETKILHGDFSWYSEDASEYTIDTVDELIGFSTLASLGNVYSGKTIKLGADIDLNEGWTATANAETPETVWRPIGTETKQFAGIFDGQNHSISGVYVESDADYVGFFGMTGTTSTVKNVRFLNSYFEHLVSPENDNDELAGYIGSVAGEIRGDLANIYSDAIIVSGNRYTGGFAGRVTPKADLTQPVNITDCWFNGQIITGTYGRYIGGITAGIIRGTCNVENTLFTGTIDASYNGEKAIYLGGIVGEVKAAAQGLNLKSVVAAGKVVGNHTSIQCNAVVGRARASVSGSGAISAPTLTLENVFATRDCYASPYGAEKIQNEEGTITAQVIVEGLVARTNGDDRLLGYIPNKTIVKTVLEDGTMQQSTVVCKLDFTNDWTLRTDGVPVPTSMSDVVKGKMAVVDSAALAKEIGLDYFDANASLRDDVEDYGAGNYLVTYQTTTDLTYAGYLEKLTTLGFAPYVDNSSTDMVDDGVHQATYKKELPEWIVNVTWVENESKIYISINTDKNSLDDNLVGATQEGEGAISLSMLEIINDEEDPYGNSFVFRLPNGHYIISDGGREDDGGRLIEYLRSEVGEGNPIYIDAWIITHYHGDHCGALTIFSNNDSYRENIYVDAIYVSEPSSYAADYWEDRMGVLNNVYRGISYLRKQDGVTRPEIYQMHMGQRYYFNGINMDVLDTQEQHSVETWADTNGELPDPFNTSSTSCLFTFADGNGVTKKAYLGGDATNVNLEYIIMAYGSNNKTLANVDVFVTLHHGHNTTAVYGKGETVLGAEYQGVANKNWADFLLMNTNNADNKFDVVLFPYYQIYRLSWEFGKGYVDHIGTNAYPYNIGDINDYYISNATSSYTYGNGNVNIVFGATIEETVNNLW